MFCQTFLCELHKDELLLKCLDRLKRDFFLSKEKENLLSCLFKNTDFHKLHNDGLVPLWFCGLK